MLHNITLSSEKPLCFSAILDSPAIPLLNLRPYLILVFCRDCENCHHYVIHAASKIAIVTQIIVMRKNRLSLCVKTRKQVAD